MTRADALRVLPLIDLTSLGDDDTEQKVDALCDAATTPYGAVAAVCVWPRFVGRARERLGDSIDVAAVANFPDGGINPAVAVADAHSIVEQGGSEVDVVFPWRALASGDEASGQRLVEATREAIGPDVTLKVIVESGELAEPELIAKACRIALRSGADFLKTSTGKTPRSATLEAARILLDAVAGHDVGAGVKISGGVRTVAQAMPYLRLAEEVFGASWISPATFRFGASSLLDDVLEHAAPT